MADSWPVDVRFFTTDDVLITAYLINKIQGDPLPLDRVVIEADVYGQHAGPWQLFQNPDAVWETRVDPCGKLIANESVRYVFTRLAKVGKGTGKKQRSRLAGGGCWHGNSAEEVEDRNGNKVGIKKTFKYKGANLPTDTVWIMNEYSVPWCEDFVLCKIKMISREKRKRGILDDVQRKSRLMDHQPHGPVEELIQPQGINVQDQSTLLEEMMKDDDLCMITLPDDFF